MIISNNQAIADILKSIDEGKTQFPDCQRGWAWEDHRISALIASISNGYPNAQPDTYFIRRQQSLLDLIENATGKEVSGREEPQVAMSQYDITEMETNGD